MGYISYIGVMIMFKSESLTGKKFGKLTAHEREHRKGRQTYYRCTCECGNEKWVRKDKLIGKITLSCGCIKYPNIIGKTFGRLTAIERIVINNKGHHICNCNCGNRKVVQTYLLVNGYVKSCGCIVQEKSDNKYTDTRLYSIYKGMKSRCYQENSVNYSRYGGRGITICEEWLTSYFSFQDWAITNGYESSLSIDRIDNDGDYEPNNCRWSNAKEQARNTRRNIKVEYKGEERTLSEIAELTGLSASVIRYRHKHNIDFDEPLKTGKNAENHARQNRNY